MTPNSPETPSLKERYQLIVESTPTAMVMVDQAGTIVLVNRQAETLFGFSREELLGRTVETLVPPRFRGRHPGAREGFFGAPESRSMGAGRDLFGLKKDGTEVPIEIGLNPMRTPEGLFVLAAIIDITERRRAEERFRLVVEAAPNAMLLVDQEGVITLVNSETEKLFGYSRAELIGKAIELLIPPRFRQAHPGHRQGFMRRPQTRSMGSGRELFGLRKDGTEVPIEIGLNPLGSADAPAVLASIIDISGRLRAEEERRKGRELEEQNRRMAEANRLKNEFLANMSHELRTPLNAVIGFSELLYDGKAGPLTPKQKEYQYDVLESSRHLLQLINDVLDLAKLEAGRITFEPEPLSIERVAGEVRDALRALAERKSLDCRAEIDPGVDSVVLDPKRLKQVLFNFLSNAYKFTPDGGRVWIRARAEGEGWVRLEVQDTGIGIRREDFPRLFVEFQQLEHHLTKQQAGTGLGLALTKRIVEAQGGRVGVESEQGQGSAFYAVLPRRAA